ncbi:MAG TPA: adenine nucleotide alpha hydrolase [Candidatus Ornithospirochaeta avicola]|uniref:Adenine nucleotide alpha hydrolase n=1 Tax=Candidatus Ornithospirochaeta avicola TaxID=2840896 RepID=A0A9D1PST2_9SPIO|nr:adenine nucleotide alpha hydrolase [Candidatus Ornithospirochaeta avicola]
MEKLSYKKLIEGEIPPWVRRFIKQTGKGINDFKMIEESDQILISASGGKDSLALSLALSLRRKWLPINYKLKAVMINWNEHPVEERMLDKLKEYYSDLDIDFTVFNEMQFPSSFKGEFNCYLCARNRRRILFSYADRMGIKKIAMGHHLDDLVETVLMNLCFRANFAPMQAVQEFFDGKLYVIRPMIQVHESAIRRLAECYDLPVVKPVCPYDQSNVRARLKPIVSSLSHLDKLTREHIYSSLELENPFKESKKDQ